MSEQMPHDEELRALYRKLPADEPRAGLDEAILSAARRRNEVEKRRKLVRRLRLAIPLAAAAGLVLTMTLTRLAAEQRATTMKATAMVSARSRAEILAESDARVDAPDEIGTPLALPEPSESLGSLRDDSLGAIANREDAQAPVAAEAEPAPAKKDEAPTPAAPPPAAAAAAMAEAPRQPAQAETPRAKNRAYGAPMEVAPDPEAKEADAQDRAQNSAADSAAGGAASSAGGAEVAERKSTDEMSGGAIMKDNAWPFGLRAGLEPQETCRLVAAALHRECAFHDDTAVVAPAAPVTIESGRYRGTVASRVTLMLRDGRLWKVTLLRPDGAEKTLGGVDPIE